MKKKMWIIGLFLLVVGLCVHHYTYTRALDERDVITGEIVVDFTNDTSPEYIAQLGKELGVVFTPESRYSDVDKLYVGEYDGEDEDSVIDELRSDSHVEAADKDQVYTIPEHNLPDGVEAIRAADVDDKFAGFPNDPRFSEQFGMKQIRLQDAWKQGATGKGIVVAVLDTGITQTQDLKDTKFVAGYNFVSNNTNTDDGNSHGTHCAGTIAQSTNNGKGVVGVAYNATLMPIKVLSDGGSGSTAGIAQGIHWAADHGANVISMSLGGGGHDKVLAKAMTYAHDKGVVIVVAAGNSARGVVSYPAKYPEAIAVAATRKDEKTTFYSNWGKEIAIAAPGGDGDKNKPENGILQNTIVNGKDDYYFYSGTSMATPAVAGVVALIMEQGVKNPDEVRKILTTTARKPKDVKIDNKFAEHYGAGIVDSAAAIKAAKASGGILSGTHWYVYVLFLLFSFIVYAVVKKLKRKT